MNNLQAHALPAAIGWFWIKQGFAIFRRQPLGLMSLVMAFLLCAALLVSIPKVGLLVLMLLTPGLSVAYMAACRDIEDGKFVLPTLLIAPFREHGKAGAQRLLMLGVIYAAAMSLLQWLMSLVDGGALAGALANGEALQADEPLSPDLMRTMVLMSISQALVSGVFWFAPVLSAWHQISAGKALFFSVVALWRNVGAFVAFGFGMLLVALAVMGGTSMILGLLGLSANTIVTIEMPIMVALTALFYCAAYVSYQTTFNAVATEPQPS